MVRRAVLLSLALVLMVFAPAAVAQEYDGATATATVTEDAIIVTAEGFEPNATVNYEVDYEPFGDENALGIVGGYEGEIAIAMNVAAPMEIVERGSTTADADGDVQFAVANRGEGTYRISMTDGVNTAVVAVTVGSPGDAGAGTGTGTAGGGALPTTGADDSVGLAQVGIAALALGAVAVYAGKRRRASAWAA